MMKTFDSFIQNCMKNKAWRNEYIRLGSPKPFDVTLRDGIQSLSPEKAQSFTLSNKVYMYKEIMANHNPEQIEIGSIISNKVLPIFADSVDLLEYANRCHKHKKNFILVPNKKKLSELLTDVKIKFEANEEKDIRNISLITSVSDSFQKKNTKKTIAENRLEIEGMLSILENDTIDYYVKLYISCINECPIEGKINNDVIVDEIMKYDTKKIKNICLSDTTGSLNDEDFIYIVDKCNRLGMPFSLFSLHLHVNNDRKEILEKIFFSALDRNITLFDVSLLESGGCSVTMNKSRLFPNLSYELYYEYLLKYISQKNT